MPPDPSQMNLTIRRVRLDDCDALFRTANHPQFIWGTLYMPFGSIEATRHWLASLTDDTYILVACPDGGELVGSIGLTVDTLPRRRHVASLGMGIRDDWQGKGIGSALMTTTLDLADNWLNLLRLELHVWTDNDRAIALYQKFGFVIEATHRAYGFRAGHYIDSYTMARVRI